MPYKSIAQEGWAHTPAGQKALGGPDKVAEWDAASKGKKLPQRVGNPSRRPQGKAKPKRSAAGYVPLTDLGM